MGDRVTTDHLLLLDEVPIGRTGLLLVEWLFRGVCENSQITQAVAKMINCSLQNDRQYLLLSKTPTELIKHGEVQPVPTWSLIPLFERSLV